MVHLLEQRPSHEQLLEMLQEYDNMIKIVVGLRLRVLAGGGEMQAAL